jgi:hypothetical protein
VFVGINLRRLLRRRLLHDLPHMPPEFQRLIFEDEPKLRRMVTEHDSPGEDHPENLPPIALMRCRRHMYHMTPPGPRSSIPHDWHLCDRCIREIRHYRADNVIARELFEHLQILYSELAPYLDNHCPQYAQTTNIFGLDDTLTQGYGEPFPDAYTPEDFDQ